MEQNRKRPGERGTVSRDRRVPPASRTGGSRPRTASAASPGAARRRQSPRQNAEPRQATAQEPARRTRTPSTAEAQAAERRTQEARAQERREREARAQAKRERDARDQTRREREAQAQERREREARAQKQREREARAQAKRGRDAREQEKRKRREQEKQERSERKARARARKKNKPHRVYNMNIGFKIVTMLAVVAVIVVSMMIFFKVKHIQVVLQGVDAAAPIATTDTAGETTPETAAPSETQAQIDTPREGHSYYTAEEVIEASGIHVDDNLLSLSKATVASRIHAALPYVNQIQIKKQLPGTVIITVSEFEVTYGIQDEAGDWWLMSREGRILEPATEQSVRGHLLITGMPIQVPKPGDWFKPAATEGADMAEIAAKQKVVLEVIPVLEEAPFVKELASVDVSTSYNLTLWYGTRYEIWLGTAENLDYKFRFLEAALADKEIQRRSGTIDLTFSEDEKAHFMEFR